MKLSRIFFMCIICFSASLLSACSSLKEGPAGGLSELTQAQAVSDSSPGVLAPTTQERVNIKDKPKISADLRTSILPVTDLSLWELIEEKDQFKTFRAKGARTNDSGIVAFRGEGTIPASIAHVISVFNDESIRKEWVDSLVETRTLRQTDELNRIEYNHTSVPWPFQDRDFVYRVHAKVKKRPTQISITLQSVEDDLMPIQPGKVRGKIIYSYYWIQESADRSSTRIVVEMAVDPAGAIPSWLAAISQKKWPYNTLSGLSRLSTKPGLVIPDALKRFLY